MNLLPRINGSTLFAIGRATSLAALLGVLLACDTPSGGSGPMPTPTFGQLHIPDPSAANGWSSYSTNVGPPTVLPTRGRGVRIYFYAPVGSAFSVSISEPPVGTAAPVVTMLPENTGTPAPPGAGHFQILDVNPSQNPPI